MNIRRWARFHFLIFLKPKRLFRRTWQSRLYGNVVCGDVLHKGKVYKTGVDYDVR